MADMYQEILIKRITPPADKLKKVALITLTAVAAALAVLTFNLIFLLAAIALGVACYFLLPGLDLEYEYLYVNGDIDIDKILSRQKRKKAESFDKESLELIAPTGHDALKEYEGKGKVKDYTSLDPNVKSYTAVYTQDSQIRIVRLELPDAVVQDMRRFAPRKVYVRQ